MANNTATKDSIDFYLEGSSNNILSYNIATNGGDGFDLYSSNNNTLISNTSLNNQEYDYYTSNSANNVLINNTFGKSLTTTAPPSIFTLPLPTTTAPAPALIGLLSILDNVDVVSIAVLGIILILGLTVFLSSRKKHSEKPQNSSENNKYDILHKQNSNKLNYTTLNHPRKISTGRDATTSITLVEDILKETYQAPDYETAVKVQQSGFPDYTTYKQALDKGIQTYAEWIRDTQDKH